MRITVLAVSAAAAFLGGCGGPDNNNASSPAAKTGPATNGMVMLAATPSKDQALKIMHDRHEAMEQLGKAMKELHRGLDASPPDANAIGAQTAIMAATAAKIPAMFPGGTGPDVGKTRAKAEIWQKSNVFLQKSKEFLVAAQAIDAAAKAGDVNKVMALHDNVDKACDGCHKPFRAPEH